jgi:hypothetical protein
MEEIGPVSGSFTEIGHVFELIVEAVLERIRNRGGNLKQLVSETAVKRGSYNWHLQ